MLSHGTRPHRLRYALVCAVMAILASLSGNAWAQESSVVDPVGVWKSVDFVRAVGDFKPGTKQTPMDLFLKDFQFLEGGGTSLGDTWKGDWITHRNGRTRAQFFIKTLDGVAYLFLPWLSGDVTERGAKPGYYVLRKQTLEEAEAIVVEEFGDIRFKDISKLDLSDRPRLPEPLTFN